MISIYGKDAGTIIPRGDHLASARTHCEESVTELVGAMSSALTFQLISIAYVI